MVAQAKGRRRPQPLLRDHARGGAGRPGLLLPRHPDQGHRPPFLSRPFACFVGNMHVLDLCRGMGGLAEFGNADLTDDELRAFKSLPSMVYYGSGTPGGALMRTLEAVRSVREPLGAVYRRSVSGSEIEIAGARNWLMERSAEDWSRAARTWSRRCGTEHRRLWRIIDGLEGVK